MSNDERAKRGAQSTKVSTHGILEALLFAAEDPLPLSRLAELIESTPGATKDELELLRLHYEQTDGALQLLEIARGYRLATKPQYAPYVRNLKKPRTARLSRAGLEVLAIVSYRQPITGPEIDHIRGVNSSGSIDTLLERGLVEIAGRKEAPGRPRLYRTTQAFLDQFGLADLAELPQLPEAELAEFSEALFTDERLADVSPEEIEKQLAAEQQSQDDTDAPAGSDQGGDEAGPGSSGQPTATDKPAEEAEEEGAETGENGESADEPSAESQTDERRPQTSGGPFEDGFID